MSLWSRLVLLATLISFSGLTLGADRYQVLRDGKTVFVDATTYAPTVREINVIASPNTADGWQSTGAGVTVVTTTTPTDLPLEGVVNSAIKITPVSGTTDYVYSCWTMPASLKNRKLKASQEQRPLSGYASGDLKLDVYTYATASCGGAAARVALSTDVSSVTGIPNSTDKFETRFDAGSSDYYGIRYTRVAGTTALNIVSVTVGPGIQPQSAAVSGDVLYTPAFSEGTYTHKIYYSRSVDKLIIWGQATVVTTGGSGSALGIGIPSNLNVTIDSSKLADLGVSGAGWGGGGQETNAADSINTPLQVRYVTSTTFGFSKPTGASTTSLRGSDLAAGDDINFRVVLPITDWAASGTVFIGENVPAFACNDGSATSYATNGCLIPTITALNDNTTTDYLITLPGVLPDEYTPVIQVLTAGGDGVWHDVSQEQQYVGLTQMYTGSGAARRNYGIGVSRISSSKSSFNVRFGNAGTVISQTFVASISYPQTAGDRYRVAFTRKGEAVGFGLATPDSSGLVKPYSTEGVVYSGVYTPTFVLSLATGGTAQEHRFTRVGSVVTVSGAITGVTVTTTGTNVSATISLPVPTANFVGTYQAGGVGYAYRNANDNKEPLYIESTNGAQTVLIALDGTTIPSAGSNTNFYYSFQYEIQ